MKIMIVVVVGWMLLGTCAQASFTAVGVDSRQILAEQRQIREEAERPKGKYSRFNDRAKERLGEAQKVIFEILATDKSLEQLNDGQRAELLTAVEEVKAILTENESDKLECWRERKTGTTIKVVRCETVAQRERIREDAKTWKGDASVCIRSSGTACGRVGE